MSFLWDQIMTCLQKYYKFMEGETSRMFSPNFYTIRGELRTLKETSKMAIRMLL